MALADRPRLLALLRFLDRFVPVVARGLALGFALLALTAFVGIGDYPTAAERNVAAGLYGLIALASFAIGLAAGPILRRLLRDG